MIGGDILFLGTGDGEVIDGTARDLRNQKGIATIEEASQAALDMTHARYVNATRGKPETLPRKGFGVDFLIGGPGRNDLGIFEINTTGFRGPKAHNKYADRGANLVELPKGNWGGSFKGSAWGHINRYLDGQFESGRPIIIETLADALIEMHDLSLRGARDIGVNDRLHYGIITPSRTVRLVHPSVWEGDTQAHIEQVVNLTGLNVAEVLNGMDADECERNSAAIDLYSDIRLFTGGFYFALASELTSSSNLKREYTRLSEKSLRDESYKPRFKEIGRRRLESHARIQEGVDVLISRDPHKLRSFIMGAEDRRRETIGKLFERYASPESS